MDDRYGYGPVTGAQHPEAATSRADLLKACLTEGSNKRGMKTYINDGALLDRVNAGNLTRSSSSFLESLCRKLLIRSYWIGTTDELEQVTGTSPDQRKKAIKKLKDTNTIKIVKSPSKTCDIWFIKVCPQIAWRGFGKEPNENPMRLRMSYEWLMDGLRHKPGAYGA
jgi:hypothetical protein